LLTSKIQKGGDIEFHRKLNMHGSVELDKMGGKKGREGEREKERGVSLY
jgi:hypothetical protein